MGDFFSKFCGLLRISELYQKEKAEHNSSLMMKMPKNLAMFSEQEEEKKILSKRIMCNGVQVFLCGQKSSPGMQTVLFSRL